ncbi:hypothetical protein L596_008177 [Steinernema carpocapsae]|uniref:Transducer of regulated CREB activity N-terminal domain-containing protein n=1 Tax=Steinernema carpocapsae TaxID=34508 RepID=A0A4U5PBX9_STECR|nr:hypothetical protein L596_008177 [Steinernema carpocapsae]
MAQGTSPRKFSEKIAIMERKQNEDQEAFCSVLREVRAITSSMSPMGLNQAAGSPGPAQIPSSPGHSGMGSAALAPPVHWNRGGGSLPNVHQMSQMQNPMYVSGPGNWSPHQGFWQQNQNSHPARGRSPGSHYHPYGQKQHKYSAERVPSLDYNMPCQPVHLQPPDSQWPNYRAISDPTIHANAYQQQPITVPNAEPYYPDSPQSSSMNQQAYSPINNHYQNDGSQQQYYDSNQIQPQRNDTPVGSLPNMNSPVFSPNFSMYNQQQHAQHAPISQRHSTAGMYQQLATPPSLMESQSAPTSPAQTMEAPCQPQWPQRHYSTSPDTRDIPNIILTGTDGQLDVFQDLNINETQLKQLLLDPTNDAVDPALENQLLSN